jgi:hypothetical protein
MPDVSWIVPMLENWPEDEVTKTFAYHCPKCVEKLLGFVTSSHYLPKITAILKRLAPDHYGVIGCLIGTIESYLLQVHGFHPQIIVSLDVDMPEYNPKRENGAYAYKNICSVECGAFEGELVQIRADSKRTSIFQEICEYDVIFVDGEHNRKAVRNDMSIAHAALKQDGVILVHDLELAGSSVSQGYFEWLALHPEYDHMEIPSKLFQCGLGVVWRK